jgi:aminopeptidase N
VVRLERLGRGWAGRAAFETYARSKLRPVFDRLGWEPAAAESEERAQLRALLIRTLGEFGDETVLAEAKRRFASFVNEPASLAADLRDPVIYLAGRTANRATYDTLLTLGRKATEGEDRNRFYSAAASALDPALAKETLAIALKGVLPADTIVGLINGVAAEHRDLAWDFIRTDFSSLAAKQGASFRYSFPSQLMSEFVDRARASELANFTPAHESARGRAAAARAQERILANADFVAQALPALDAWLAQRALRQQPRAGD